MYTILGKRMLHPTVHEYVIDAPFVARNAKPGQFIILRTDEDGERVPFTICDMDKILGTVTISVQTIGYTTARLASMNVGDALADFVGPLGNPTDLENEEHVLLVGGGIGAAVIYPQAKSLARAGKKPDVILGARTEELVMYKNELMPYCNRLFVMTDDGSCGKKGFVTDKLKELLESNGNYSVVMAVGPLRMMQAVSNLTKQFGVKTLVSMNSVMVDGTGMCGCCRLTVGGETKYACVDGPEFDGHLVDFDEAIRRSSNYKEEEKDHYCNIRG